MPATGAHATTKVLIDADPGTDDALALMMAFNSPSLVVQGITTVGGNATLAHTTRNALRLVEYLGFSDDQSSGVPVAKGAARPLQGSFHYGYYFHGPAGLGLRLPAPRTRPHSAPADRFIVDMVSASPGELTVVALGPLTNIAGALALEPKVAGWIREIVVMGGAAEVPGNVTPHAEFNIYNDPEAAAIVLSSGAPVTMVGLDVCNQTVVARDDLPWVPGTSNTAEFANTILGNWFRRQVDRDAYNLCDPLALVAALDPGLLTYWFAHVSVELEDIDHRGKTTPRYGAGPVRVAVGVDVAASRSLMVGLLQSDRC